MHNACTILARARKYNKFKYFKRCKKLYGTKKIYMTRFFLLSVYTIKFTLQKASYTMFYMRSKIVRMTYCGSTSTSFELIFYDANPVRQKTLSLNSTSEL